MQGGTGTAASLSSWEKVVTAPSSTYRNLPSGSLLHGQGVMSLSDQAESAVKRVGLAYRMPQVSSADTQKPA